MIRINNSPYLSKVPVREGLEKLTIAQLIDVCRYRRRNSNPFKKALVDYLMNCDKL